MCCLGLGAMRYSLHNLSSDPLMNRTKSVTPFSVRGGAAMCPVPATKSGTRDLVTSDAELAKFFQDPPAEFRSKPFWAWNGGYCNEQEIVRQVKIFKQMGFGGFFMHSRTGLQTEYLGDAWFRMVNAAAKEAGKQGIQAWLYDEDRWPSGFAGGLVTEKPEYRMKFLSMHSMPVADFHWRG